MSSSSEGRIAVITGGGSGLGLATAKRLLATGFRVHALGKMLEKKLADPGFSYQDLDVTDAAAVREFAGTIEGLDALVNAAGILLHDGAEFSEEGFARVMTVNVNGTQLMCRSLHGALKKNGGSIVNFSSVWGQFGSARNPAYAASKGAVLALTRSLAVGWAGEGIRVNAVIPGWIRSRMSKRAMSDPERNTAILARIPMKRWGEPDDVAAVVEFLVSDSARYVTGVALPIDGGYCVA